MTVADNEGCSAQPVTTGQTVSCNGGSRAAARADADVTVPPDTTPPDLRLAGSRLQELGRTVFVKARCNEQCAATASGRLVVKRATQSPRSELARLRFKLKRKTAQLAPARSRKLKLAIPRPARRAAAAALAGRGGAATARLKVSARDAARNRATAKRPVRLKD